MAGEQEVLARLANGELRELLQLIVTSDIEELELDLAGTRLSFKRPVEAGPQVPGPVVEASVGHVGADGPSFIVAERVGFFHFASGNGGAAPQAGDPVAVGQVLGVIDSLSVRIPVQAPAAGVLEETLVEEGQPVEFGQPLFVVASGKD